MSLTYDFTGQVALVTGASSGMGLATARAFADAGAAVVLADINHATLQTATDDITAAGRQALAVTCDVSREEDVAAMVDRTVATFGRLDMAFNNAGIQAPPTDAADEPADTFDRINAINLRGIWACMKHELGQMRAQGSGAIVNCSSLGGLVELPGHHRDADGHRHDRQRRAQRPGRHRQPAHRPTRPCRRDRRVSAVAMQSGRQLRCGGRPPRRWWLHRPLTGRCPPRGVDETAAGTGPCRSARITCHSAPYSNRPQLRASTTTIER